MKSLFSIFIVTSALILSGCDGGSNSSNSNVADGLNTKEFVMELPVNPENDAELLTKLNPNRKVNNTEYRYVYAYKDALTMFERILKGGFTFYFNFTKFISMVAEYDPDDPDWDILPDADGDGWPDKYDYDVYGTGYFDIVVPSIQQYNPDINGYDCDGTYDIVKDPTLFPFNGASKTLLIGESYYFMTFSELDVQKSNCTWFSYGVTGDWSFTSSVPEVLKLSHSNTFGDVVATALDDGGAYPRKVTVAYDGKDYNGAIGGSDLVTIAKEVTNPPTITKILFNGKEIVQGEAHLVKFSELPSQTPIEIEGNFTKVRWNCTSGKMSSETSDGIWYWDTGYNSTALLLITAENADGVIIQRKILLYEPVVCTQNPLK